MKLFKVWVDNVGYDAYDSFVCIARSEDEIWDSIKINKYNERVFQLMDNEGFMDSVYFDNFQGEIHIEEINLDEVSVPYIVLASYNAG